MIEKLPQQRLALIDDNIEDDSKTLSRKMGRQMVSISFKKALEKDGDSELFLLPPQIPCRNLRENSPPWEALFVGDPNLNPYAEERLWGNPKNCSLLGITHTLSTPAPLKIIPKIPYSPLFKWDALICTSTAAQNAVKTIWDHSDEILIKRGGKPAESHLPLILLVLMLFTLTMQS